MVNFSEGRDQMMHDAITMLEKEVTKYAPFPDTLFSD
jgi:hypothetical protein